MKTVMLLLFSVILLLLQACAYKGKLEQSYKPSMNFNDSFKLKVALIDNNIKDEKLMVLDNNWEIDLVIGEYILDAIEKELKNSFSDITVLSSIPNESDYDIIIKPYLTVKETWNSSQGDFAYVGEMILIATRNIDKKTISHTKNQFSGDFYNSESCRVRANLCFLTLGLTKSGIEKDMGSDVKKTLDTKLSEEVKKTVKSLISDKKFVQYANAYKNFSKFKHTPNLEKNMNTNNYALIIGNNNYDSFPNLLTPINDAQALAEILQNDYNFQTYLLENATRADIVGIMGKLKQDLTKNDNLLIYYAGHGWLDKEEDEGYWLPVNADKADESAWLSNSTITTKLKAMDANHVFVIADSCYSGKLTRGVGIRSKKKGDDYTKRARSVLSSGGLEPVVDSGGNNNNHSIFLSSIINSLKNNTGTLTAEGLYNEIKRPVVLEADQTPEYSDIRNSGHEGGEFLFEKKNRNK